MRLTRSQLGTLAGLGHGGGTLGTSLSRLRMAGYVVEEGDLITATEAGISALGDVPPAPSWPDELVATWRRAVGENAAGRLLDVLVDAYPQWMTRDAFAAACGLTADAGTFGTDLSRLRSNALTYEEGGRVRLAESPT